MRRGKVKRYLRERERERGKKGRYKEKNKKGKRKINQFYSSFINNFY